LPPSLFFHYSIIFVLSQGRTRLRDADSILIFGSGEAKQEFRKRLEKDKKLGDRIVDVLTTDKMTDPQIAAKVREYFHDNPKHTKERN
jgi:hypothetical protein